VRRALLVVALACACGPSPSTDAGSPGDAGAVDDAGAPDDDAGVVDDDAGTSVPIDPVDPACTTNGCLRAVLPLGTFPQAVVEQYLDEGVVIDNGYSVARVTFFTDGLEARAIVTIPEPIVPPSGGYHVVVHAPGTVGVGDVCAAGEGALGVGLSGYFGAYGFIGVALDYPGLGTPGAHPYLVARVEGRAALDAARAGIAHVRRHLVPVSRRVAIAGNSQGGHATIAAAREHATYAPELDVRAFVAAAPASMQLDDWAAGVVVDGPHLVYHALVVHAWAAHYGHGDAPLFAPAIADDVDAIMDTHCVVGVDGQPLLESALPQTSLALFDADFLSAYSGASLAAYPAIAIGFEENAFEAFPFTAPLRIYQGTADAVVLPAMTQALVATLESAGEDVDYVEVAGAGHTEVAFGVVAFDQLRAAESRAYIRALLDQE